MDPLNITDKERLFEMLASRRTGKARFIDEAEMNAALKARVQGQDHIVDDVCRFLRLQWGKEQRGKPVANVLFVGPKGVGKTELAKALAEYLFGDDSNMLRFDSALLHGPEAVRQLIGTPTGYVGASKGGQLTRPMFSNPKRLVFFDEIEKADAKVFDLFLSMMGEGRLAEAGSNKVADFTQAAIVLTSNAEQDAMVRLLDQFEDPDEVCEAARDVLENAQVFRPEIISRFDRVYVFKPLDEETRARIAGLKIAKAGEEFGVTIDHIAPEIVFEIVTQGDDKQDARGLVRAVDKKLGDLLWRAKESDRKRITIVADANGEPRIKED